MELTGRSRCARLVIRRQAALASPLGGAGAIDGASKLHNPSTLRQRTVRDADLPGRVYMAGRGRSVCLIHRRLYRTGRCRFGGAGAIGGASKASQSPFASACRPGRR